MFTKEQILLSIKQKVLETVPDATVFLFGSRANGMVHDESDWDILVLTNQQVTRELKQQLHHHIFPISVSIASFINLIIVSKNDWQDNPSYFLLKQGITTNNVAI
jgi:uncharacterized protein